MTSDPTPVRVILASANSNKLREYAQILARTGVEIVAPADAGIDLDVPEDGSTFLENARVKAVAFSKVTDCWVMGDDSGLAVDSLGGRPGVHSRRFGSKSSDADRIAYLLEEIQKSDSSSAGARFICAIAVARHGKVIFETERSCEGTIAKVPRGDGGFGYDPVFIPGGYSATLGELGANVKNRISHRSLAAADVVRFLRGIED